MRVDIDQLRQASGTSVGAWCELCRVFQTNEHGHCPVCQPSPTGDLVGDLIAQRTAPPARPVTDDRLHVAGLLSDDGVA